MTAQPLLHDGVVALRAPTQVWSRADGDIGDGDIDGIYHGDTRFVRRCRLTVGDARPVPLDATMPTASRAVFGALLPGLDDPEANDPGVRLVRTREVRDGVVSEHFEVTSGLDRSVHAVLRLEVEPEFAAMHGIKAGRPEAQSWDATATERGIRIAAGERTAELSTDGDASLVEGSVVLTWELVVAPRGVARAAWRVRLYDPGMVVRGARSASRLRLHGTPGDARAARWAAVALDDLDALRLSLPEHPDDEFYAAGAPWFFTLFGRDCLWAARLALRADPAIAASTLRVLARRQGSQHDVDTAQEPGKILHELRAAPFAVPAEHVLLPPEYFGTVDATVLWVCLLADAVDEGMPAAQLRELLPALRACLAWISGHGEGFLTYQDRSGQGLANQGWKDSGDAIQWRDGTLARGPIALCEVQGYAFEAATRGADLLERMGESGETMREWAARLRQRFADRFWVTTSEGRYPAVALDADGKGVDTLTSNIGHLLGTGILDASDAREVARLLTGPTMLSGFGIRTLSTEAAGYWPLSYHCGSVWTHDTAIIARGMARAGLLDEARVVVGDLLRAAEGFDYRVPELHAGDPPTGEDDARVARPVPYPAACRPQAWSAAAAITAAEVLGDAVPQAVELARRARRYG